MSLQLKKKGFIPFSFVVTSAAVVAAGFVLVSTYPHIKSVFLSFFRINNEELDHIEEIDVLEIEAGQPLMDVSKWSDEDLKIYLQEVRN